MASYFESHGIKFISVTDLKSTNLKLILYQAHQDINVYFDQKKKTFKVTMDSSYVPLVLKEKTKILDACQPLKEKYPQIYNNMKRVNNQQKLLL